MEPTNQPFRKENDLPNLHEDMFHVNLQGCTESCFLLLFSVEQWKSACHSFPRSSAIFVFFEVGLDWTGDFLVATFFSQDASHK